MITATHHLSIGGPWARCRWAIPTLEQPTSMTNSVIHFLASIMVTGLLTSPLKAQELSAPSDSSPIKITSNDQDKDKDKDKDDEKEKENYEEKEQEKEWELFEEKDCYNNYKNYSNYHDKDMHDGGDKDCYNKVPEGGASIALLGLALAGLGAARRLTQKA